MFEIPMHSQREVRIILNFYIDYIKRDFFILISFLLRFVSSSFLVNIGKEMSLPGFRSCLIGELIVFFFHKL